MKYHPKKENGASGLRIGTDQNRRGTDLNRESSPGREDGAAAWRANGERARSPSQRVGFVDEVDLVEYDAESPAATIDAAAVGRRKVALRTAEEAKKFAQQRRQREAETDKSGEVDTEEATRRREQSERDKAAAAARGPGKGRGKSTSQWLRKNQPLFRKGGKPQGPPKGKGKGKQQPRGRGGARW